MFLGRLSCNQVKKNEQLVQLHFKFHLQSICKKNGVYKTESCACEKTAPEAYTWLMVVGNYKQYKPIYFREQDVVGNFNQF